jgi:hypothetical protein
MRASFLKIPTFVVASKRWHPFGPALQIATAAVTDHIRIQKNRLVSESFWTDPRELRHYEIPGTKGC